MKNKTDNKERELTKRESVISGIVLLVCLALVSLPDSSCDLESCIRIVLCLFLAIATIIWQRKCEGGGNGK